MIVHSYYDEDPRVRREAESLVEAGHDVDVYALRRADDSVVAETTKALQIGLILQSSYTRISSRN